MLTARSTTPGEDAHLVDPKNVSPLNVDFAMDRSVQLGLENLVCAMLAC